MQMLNKRDVVKEIMRAKRLAQGVSDQAVIEALKDYAREVERSGESKLTPKASTVSGRRLSGIS
jgi:hypothetical protein